MVSENDTGIEMPHFTNESRRSDRDPTGDGTEPMRILILEDVSRDADLAVRELRRSGIACEVRVADTGEQMIREFDAFRPHIILSDYMMPQFTGMEALKIRNEHCPEVPFVVLTASINEETAVECIKRGADDYVTKQHLIGLAPAVRSALKKKQLEATQHLAREQVRLAARQWRFTFDAMRDGVALLDPELKILRCNRAFRDLIGKPWDRIIGKPCCRLVHGSPEPPPACPAIRAGSSMQREMWETTMNGRRFELVADPVVDEGRRLTGIVHVAMDVTERKATEKALRESEKKYRFLFDNVATGIVISDMSGQILAINGSMSETLGYGTGAFSEIRTTSSYEDLGDRKKLLELLNRNGRVDNFETRLKRKNGDHFWASLTSRIIQYRGESAILTSMLDITKPKETEAALQASEEKYRTLIEYAGEVVMVSQDGLIQFVNRKIEDILGYSPEEIIGKPFVDYIHPEDRETVAERHVRRLKNDNPPAVYDFRAVGRDGVIRWIRISSARTQWEEKPAALSFMTDITERRRDEDEKVKLHAQLIQSQKMEAVGRLAGGIVHDFNNLLTIIIGYANLLLENRSREDSDTEDIREIKEAADRAAPLIRQLLAFSRKQVLQPRPIDLNEVLRDMEKLLLRLLGEEIELNTVFADDIGWIEADPVQIEQVIMNLAINAKDAMPDGGRLTIETYNTDVDATIAEWHGNVEPGPYVMLTVSDTGTGIDHTIISEIFDPFFTTKPKEKGTGLGLSTVYGIVKQTRGDICVYSEAGNGTTFKIMLPWTREKADRTRKTDKAAIKPLTGLDAVLVVEDDEMVLKVVKKTLEPAVTEILTARTGEDALGICEKHEGPVNLMITDIMLPGMNGRELAERLIGSRPEMKVLFMSGYADNAIVQHHILERGMAFLQKPFTPESLAQKITEMVEA